MQFKTICDIFFKLTLNLNIKKNIILLLAITLNTIVYTQNITILNPSENIGMSNWRIVNDGVMGGVSQSSIYINQENSMVFNGYLSLDNNGGFASCRMGFNGSNLEKIQSFIIKVKGDGNIYKFRLRMNGSYANYSADFETKKDEWIDVIIPIVNFKPYYFGRSTRAPKLKLQKVNSIGILISDKQEGKFALEIEYIKAL